jgi:hypothetical protein
VGPDPDRPRCAGDDTCLWHPLRYHGSNVPGLQQLIPQGGGSATGYADEVGKVFLTPSPDVAAGYAHFRAEEYGGLATIYQVLVPVSQLKLNQPKYYRATIPELVFEGPIMVRRSTLAPSISETARLDTGLILGLPAP